MRTNVNFSKKFIERFMEDSNLKLAGICRIMVVVLAVFIIVRADVAVLVRDLALLDVLLLVQGFVVVPVRECASNLAMDPVLILVMAHV